MISALQTSTHPFLMSLGSTFGSGNDQVINVTEKSFHPHVDLASHANLRVCFPERRGKLYQTQTAFEEAIESIDLPRPDVHIDRLPLRSYAGHTFGRSVIR
jgi:hypothetical protein